MTLPRLVEAGLVPGPPVTNFAEDVGGADDVVRLVVERREAEAHQVGRAEIADHLALDQRLHHRIAVRDGRSMTWLPRGAPDRAG